MVKQFASGEVRGQVAPSPRYCSRGNANTFCQMGTGGFVGMLQTHVGCGERRVGGVAENSGALVV